MNQRIGDILIEKGVITEEILQQTLTIQTKTGKKLGEVLVDEKFITENDLAEAISERLGVPKLSLENISIDPDLVKLIGYEIAKKPRLVPVFKLGNTLTVAMADPLDVVAMDELRYLTKLRINRVVSTNSSVMAAIEEHYSMKDSLDKALEDAIRQKEADLLEADPDQRDEALAGEAPVIKYVNLLVVQAIKNKASDIHIEPDENSVRVRYRVSGLLRQEGSPPKAVQSALITRLKIMADVDVSEKRVPQDGRFTFKWGNQKVDVRLSTLPTIHGEKIVMRLLDRRNLLSGMGSLGFDDNMLEQFRKIAHKPEGLILISGPTGSGKTSTLYALLDEINTIEKNIITIEDPVEYNLLGINQVQTNEKAGLTFASCLRSILRQNPDVIMVGEIRDAETAAIAVRSAMTGHLVLSTIHTNDAPGAVSRLLDMGVEGYLLASSLLGVLAQRLVRVICPTCTVEDEVPSPLLRELELGPHSDAKFFQGAGCEDCHNTGYRGQMGVYEFLEVTDRIKEMILTNASSSRIKAAAIADGMVTLHNDALSKALEGRTTYREVLRVSQRNEEKKRSEVDARTVQV
ncbi:MAG: Flp pilus assembly complex ATPase component TadA [candidate division Zixibacteria bacterium]|nr:Flp pilus assembly complex ATPase component TadA [candidate division Zixibacteria bacterium]